MNTDKHLEKASNELWLKPITVVNDTKFQIVTILPSSPPLDAYWWKGKQVHLIGVDVDGNFFLRHCDGTVRLWLHNSKSEVTAFNSVKEFTASLREDDDNSYYWGKRNEFANDKLGSDTNL